MTGKSCLLLLLALAGPGCLTQTAHLEEEAKKMPPVQTVEMTQPMPAVTPDQVSESNAGEVAQALARELDQAAHEQPNALPLAGPKEGMMKP